MSARASESQKAARTRNHKIFRLRGLWWNVGMLSPDRAAQVRKIIDEQLFEMGTEPEQRREDKRKAERAADWNEL